MKRIEFDCTFDLTEEMISLLGELNETYPVISVYGHYDAIKSLLEELIMSGITISESIELESYQIDFYDKEFVLYLTEDGVSVCKCWKYDEYLNGSGDVSFVHEDCSSKLLKHIDSKINYEFGIVDYEDDCECDECCSCCEFDNEIQSDGDMHGFSVSKSDDCGYSSYSFYSTDLNLVNEMAKLFR